MRETSTVETRVSHRGHKSALSQKGLQNIDQMILVQSDNTIHEGREVLQLSVSDETVRRAVVKLGHVYKKESLQASEQEPPRCQEQTGRVEKPYVCWGVEQITWYPWTKAASTLI